MRPSQGKLRGLALCGDHFSESRSRLGLTWLFPILLVDGAVWHSEQHGGKERKALPGKEGTALMVCPGRKLSRRLCLCATVHCKRPCVAVTMTGRCHVLYYSQVSKTVWN